MRDPRISPYPGAILSKRVKQFRSTITAQRVVTNVTGWKRFTEVVFLDTRARGIGGSCSLYNWRKWAKDAEVVQHAD